MIFAYYLPQFHFTPENDSWWEKDFTEWTNVKKAKPLFKGHQQPLIPGDLGYYNLETNETMRKQAKLAKNYGIDGFVFYHYWFGNGKTLLEKPILNFLYDSSIDIQFCICWANESWKGTWHGAARNQLLQEQNYLGKEDYEKHFQFLLPFFRDPRILKIEDKPIYQIYVPESIPDLEIYIETFNDLAFKAGLKGIYWMGVKYSNEFDPIAFAIKGLVNNNLKNINRYHHKSVQGFFYRNFLSNPIIRKTMKWPKRIPFRTVRDCLEDFPVKNSCDFYPLAIPNWDNTPRVGEEGTVYTGCSPLEFKEHLKVCLSHSKVTNDRDRQIVFIKSWNEWAEGNILEPEQRYRFGYLEIIKELVSE